MINLKIKATFLVLVLSASVVFAQTDSVMYYKGFEFNEGIYITVKDFRNNSPKLTAQNFAKYNQDYTYNNGKIESNISSPTDTIYYPDSGSVKGILLDDIFGYTDKHDVYFFATHKLILKPQNKSERKARTRQRFKVKYVGEICYMYGEDDYSTTQTVATGPGTSTSYQAANTAPSKQLLVNFHKWRTKEFSIKNFSELLKIVDESVYKEFMALSKSMRKKSWFIYLEKVNKAHPVYFPVNK